MLTSGSSSSGVFTVGANGRVLASGIGKHNSVLYLVAQNDGFSLGTGANCESGFLAPQSGGPFTNASVESPPTYSFGTVRPEDSHIADISGVASFDGNGNMVGTVDDDPTGNGGSLNPGQSITYTYAIDSTGTGVIPAGCTFTAGNCDFMFIVISPPSATSPFGEVVLMDANSSNTYPALKPAVQ